MAAVILITSLGARPSPLQSLLLALMGVLLAGVTVLLVDFGPDSASGEIERD